MDSGVDMKSRRSARWAAYGASLAMTGALSLSACATLPAAGPSTRAVKNSDGQPLDSAAVRVVDVDAVTVRRLATFEPPASLALSLGDAPVAAGLIGTGDILDISIWEAPPAVLFGSPAGAAGVSEATSVARSTQLPEQAVSRAGTITVPFAGTIMAAGRPTQEVAADIRSRLTGKAHDPQVIVRLSRNATSNVTVVGEVTNSMRMPLTAKGERLLDALAGAGGVRQPVNKMTIQVTRGDHVEAMPLAAVIRDPQQNIRLQAEDVITLLFQPYSFTVLGAAKINQEIPFEGTGLTLSQALGRMGGLEDQRASPRGVFIFRFEDAGLFGEDGRSLGSTKGGKVPVIYRVDMKDPKTLFVAQSFPIKDKDVIYVSNAPLADFSKFLQALSQIVYPIATIQNARIF